MKRLIALVIVASFLFSILAPLGLSIQSTQEKTITNPLRVTYFFFGRIDDLQRDDYATSFIGKNVLLYFYSNSPDMKGWYAGHIKGTQRFYVSSDYEFHGFMTLHFVCGVFKHQLPSTPSIMFMSNIFDNSITVMSVSPENILWSDITNVGSGSCVFPPNMYVTAGDNITDCYGTIQLLHIPTNTILATFDFPSVPSIMFTADQVDHTLTVVSVSPRNVPWSDIANIGEGSCNVPLIGSITAGDVITNCLGTITLEHTPSSTIIGTFDFPS